MMGSLWVEEPVDTSWSRFCTVNHWASLSNFQLSNMRHPTRDSTWHPERLEVRTLTTTPPSPLNTVQTTSQHVVGRTEETSTYNWPRFCSVKCPPMASNYQLSHLRASQEPNPKLRDGRQQCYHSATMATLLF